MSLSSSSGRLIPPRKPETGYGEVVRAVSEVPSVSDLLAISGVAGGIFAVLLTILALFPALAQLDKSGPTGMRQRRSRVLRRFILLTSAGSILAGSAAIIAIVKIVTLSTGISELLSILISLALLVATSVVPVLAVYLMNNVI
jgi:hypothetical protein